MAAEPSPQALTRRLVLATCAAGLWPVSPAMAGRQIEEPLSHAVRTALSAAVAGSAPPALIFTSADERQAHDRWLLACSTRLTSYMPHPVERQEFLQTLWYETRRAGLSLSLVLGLVQVESGFRKHAVSSAGALGYMQIMPFWARLIGDGDAGRLFHMQTNLRFGCVILRYLLDREAGDAFMGLGRYNGSRGQAAYPNAVMAAQRAWRQVVD
ncbi:lytic transglycosylase domain-containing protein [Limnohabitans radicicola]|uniref:Lytic transglycosylase domain-containing protein n=1 Tax=Limnohabitans radicicola TaxID=2771427 RepID=A0A927IIA0_9BURK|nr:lytic transglycosylase domain-containing protein [Limnohabitans radicicola]MBD8049384.1 lytic transglycosylase domain-containing protein [Limnohabitans radicicola]